MVHKDIFASDNFMTLLQNNKPKKIGELRNEKYYLSTQKLDVECKVVAFDFDQDGKEDLFFFNGELLVFHVLCENSFRNRSWLYESLMSNSKSISVSELINHVVETYTANELGF